MNDVALPEDLFPHLTDGIDVCLLQVLPSLLSTAKQTTQNSPCSWGFTSMGNPWLIHLFHCFP